MKSKSLQEQLTLIKEKSSSKQDYVVEGQTFHVIAHYLGEKDINNVIKNTAKKKAYRDMEDIH